MSRRTGGRPGDRIDGRLVKVTIHPGPRPKNHLLLEALRRPVESAQYVSIRYTERLAEAGAVRSVGRKGDSYDNAAAESLNGLYKSELIRHRGPWKGLDDVELATMKWVDWYNHRRLHSACGYRPPAEFEEQHHRQIVGYIEDVPAEPSLH